MSVVSSSDLLGLGQIEERLAEPEPLCLGLLVIEARSAPDGTPQLPAPALVAAATLRLRETLRPYDELQSSTEGRFAIILPTLADSTALHRRMAAVFRAVEAPYPLAGGELRVRALLGAAVRTPQEEPADFLARVIAAVDIARDSDGRAPVLLRHLDG